MNRRPTDRRGRRALAAAAAAITITVAGTAAGVAAPANAAGSGQYLFATLADNRLAAIDRTSGDVVTTTNLGAVADAPHPDLLTDESGATLFVPTGASITLVDTRTLATIATLTDPSSSPFTSIAVSPDGNWLYGMTADGHVTVFDVPDRTLVRRAALPSAPAVTMPRRLAATNDGVFATTGETVEVMSTADSGFGIHIPLTGTAGSIAYDASDDRVYALQQDDDSGIDTFAVIDASTWEQSSTMRGVEQIGLTPISIDPKGEFLLSSYATEPSSVQATSISNGNVLSIDLPGRVGIPAIPDVAGDTVAYVPMLGTSQVVGVDLDSPEAPNQTLTLPANVLAVAAVDAPPVAAPTITSLTGGDGQVTVAFTDSALNPATAYLVTASNFTEPSRGGQTAQAGGGPITLWGLTNGDGYTFTVTAIGADGSRATSAPSDRLTIGVAPAIDGGLPNAKVGVSYSESITATGAPKPTLVLDPGTPLPDGLQFDADTGTVSGTPTAAGSTYLFFEATNAVGFASTGVTLVVEDELTEPAPGPSPSPAPGGPDPAPNEPSPMPGTPSVPTTTGTSAQATPFTATGGGRTLARTGVDATLGLLAAAVMAVGAGLAIGARRRPASPHHRS